ncbi:RICIN domain-containing protein [Streptomyces sp. NPDC002566]|uniref:RICIN domain-containing protein n=1 Tax=Streptomyces sp. NPDC002566 TaxID=3364650 RepID=UPI0036CAE86E
MRTTRTKTAATMLAGALLAVASPALAHAQPSQGSDTTTVSQSSEAMAPRAVITTRIKNRKSGKFLQAVSTANGARVVQQENVSTSLQVWEPYTFDGYWTFENHGAGRNLGIDGASTASGAAAIIADGSSDSNQDWVKQFTTGDYFRLMNRKSSLCLGVSGGSTANGAAVGQFPCDGSTNQQWVTQG